MFCGFRSPKKVGKLGFRRRFLECCQRFCFFAAGVISAGQYVVSSWGIQDFSEPVLREGQSFDWPTYRFRFHNGFFAMATLRQSLDFLQFHFKPYLPDVESAFFSAEESVVK